MPHAHLQVMQFLVGRQGQTEAAHVLCSALPPNKKLHYLQMGVGHYGVFNGSRFRKEVVPRIVSFVNANA